MLRIFIVAGAIAIALVVAKRDHWVERAGLVGTCRVTRSPYNDTAQWWACREGVITGFPVLRQHQCDSEGLVAGRELWRCPVPLEQAPGGV